MATALWIPEQLAQHTTTKAIIRWNIGAIVYLILAARMMFWSTHERMRVRAVQHDEGRVVILILVVTAAVMCLGAIVAELAVLKDLKRTLRISHVALAAITIVTSWA